jgi:penicillin-binding protein 1A
MSDPVEPETPETEPTPEADAPDGEVTAEVVGAEAAEDEAVAQEPASEAPAAEEPAAEEPGPEEAELTEPAVETAPGEEAEPVPVWMQRRWQVTAGIAAVFLMIVAIIGSLLWSLPLNRALEPLSSPVLILVADNGQPIAKRGSYKEAPIDARKLPKAVPDAFVAIEDRRFYKHMGVDPLGIIRAVRANAQAGGVAEGGSTITQQLAKNAFLTNKRSLRRKAQEALIALYLETRLSKDEILSRYLSSVYFGEGAFGLRAASQRYFNKSPEDLSIGEAAMLAGLVKAPSRLAPSVNPDGARERMRVVLNAMVETGAITKAQAARAARSVTIAPGPKKLPTGSYFADWVIPQAREVTAGQYGETIIKTTLDPQLQAQAEKIIRTKLQQDGRMLNVTQAALVAMRPDGRVVAMVGGKDYKESQFNRADGERQPGSSFKLFVYLAALRKGMTPMSPILDAPVQVSGYTPRNHEGKYAGREVPLITAFAGSSNVAAVRLAKEIGPDAIIATARSLGIREEIPKDLTLALGTGPMSLVDLTAAYAAIAAGQAPITPHGLATFTPPVRPRPLGKAELAGMRQMLSSATQRGTGIEAAIPGAFGKTGTTQNYRDALFVGWVGDLVVGVWVGNDNNDAMYGVVGGGLPARIWKEFVSYAVNRDNPKPVAPVEEELPAEEVVADPGAEVPLGPDGQPLAQPPAEAVAEPPNDTPADPPY